MRKQFVVLSFTASILLSLFLSNLTYAQSSKKKWNNPEAQKRYQRYLKETAEAHRNEAKAWENYNREVKRAQDDVRTVRNSALKGAVRGGAAGAAVGTAKGAGKVIYQRGKEAYKNRKK